mmetsp:Transcript_80097/g.141820  ORF Transcript_80097/g.141820 Transcript_80097/m.141820 type:complete len:206 (-) Transcript_80097:49-666(-)
MGQTISETFFGGSSSPNRDLTEVFRESQLGELPTGGPSIALRMLSLSGSTLLELPEFPLAGTGEHLRREVALQTKIPWREVNSLVVGNLKLDLDGQELGHQLEKGGIAEPEAGAFLELQLLRQAWTWDGLWTCVWESGESKDFEIKDGAWDMHGLDFKLNTDIEPVMFQWPDGTVQTVREFHPPNVIWKTSNPQYRRITWFRRES